MTKTVLIPGFSISHKVGTRVAEGIGESLEHHGFSPGQIEVVTFPDAMDQPEELGHLCHGADVITHSAGILALYGAKPNIVRAFSPVMPVSRPRLMARTIVKAYQMFGEAGPSEMLMFHLETGGEIMRSALRGGSHLPYFLNGMISGGDASSIGGLLQDGGSRVDLVFAGRDVYFPPTSDYYNRANSLGLGVVCLPGALHDSLVLDPKSTIDEYLARKPND